MRLQVAASPSFGERQFLTRVAPEPLGSPQAWFWSRKRGASGWILLTVMLYVELCSAERVGDFSIWWALEGQRWSFGPADPQVQTFGGKVRDACKLFGQSAPEQRRIQCMQVM